MRVFVCACLKVCVCADEALCPCNGRIFLQQND